MINSKRSMNDNKQLTQTQNRKDDHIKICLDEKVQFKKLGNGLEKYRFDHCCLPDLDYPKIDLSTTFCRI